MEKTINALLISGITAAFIFVLILLTFVVSRLPLVDSYKGAIVGCFFGLLIAAVIIRRVPLETQLVVIGALIGVGADFLTALKEPTGPKTVVDRLSKMIAGLVEGIGAAARETALRAPRQKLIAGGLWTFFATLLLVLVVGNLF